jgi:hypothetical protein
MILCWVWKSVFAMRFVVLAYSIVSAESACEQ